jgi:RNA polymerase sigma-70 factor (ECF subfamily)
VEDWTSVDDIVSEAFLLLWQARDKIQSDEHLRNYLFITVRYRMMKHQQDKTRQDILLEAISSGMSDMESTDPLEVDTEMMHLLHDAIKALPQEYRRILELSYESELNSGEISRLLNVNAATIRTQKRRAIQLIKEWVRKQTIVTLPFILFSGCLYSF